MSGAREQAGIVADNDEDKESRKHREILLAELGSQCAVKVILQASYRHFRNVLQLSGHILHIARSQPTEQRKNSNDGPHRRYGAGNFQWSDGKQCMGGFFHSLTSFIRSYVFISYTIFYFLKRAFPLPCSTFFQICCAIYRLLPSAEPVGFPFYVLSTEKPAGGMPVGFMFTQYLLNLPGTSVSLCSQLGSDCLLLP